MRHLVRKPIALMLVMLMLLQMLPFGVFAEGEQQTGVKDSVEYTLFSGSKISGMTLNGSTVNIKGDVHTNNNFSYQGSSLVVEGVCEAAGKIDVKESKAAISSKNEGAELLEMPNVVSDIKDIAMETAEISNISKKYNGDSTSLERSIIVNGSIDFKGSKLSSKGYIVAKNDISFNSAKTESNNEAGIVVCSEDGNISFNGASVNLKGVIYAPKGTVTINSANFTLKGRIIADKIVYKGSTFKVENFSEATELIIDIKKPVIELVNDNGVMEFSATEIDKRYKYTLNIKQGQSNNIKSIEVDATEPIVIEKESVTGVYQYQLIGITPRGKTAESNIVNYIVTDAGSGLVENDSDADGLSAEEEAVINTDANNFDTDGDGLNDGYEYRILGTDPTKADTDENGVPDTDEDADLDGLSNLEEYKLGSNPLLEDTDKDGISDYEEVKSYKTNPLSFDTDEDTLSDNDDLILGFDPLKKDSDDDGILDSDEQVKQEVSNNNIAEELLQENDALPSLSLVTNGNVNTTAAIRQYDGTEFGDSRSIVGKPIELTGFEVENANLEFEINEAISPLITMEGETFSKLIICRYDEEGNTEYLETRYDEKTNSLSAEIDKAGTYFVLDVETLFGELGITLPTEKAGTLTKRTSLSIDKDADQSEEPAQSFTEEQLQSMENPKPEEAIQPEEVKQPEEAIQPQESDIEAGTDKAEVIEQIKAGLTEAVDESKTMTLTSSAAAQADIVFIVDTTGSMGDEISNVKNNIIAFVDALKAKGIAPNFALIDFEDITVDGMDSTRVHKNGTSNWFTNAEDYKAAIASLSLGWGGDAPECDVDALETGRLLNLRESAGKFFVLVTDANYKVDNRYGIPSMAYEIELLRNANINTSVVAPTYLEYTYRDLYTNTGGIFVNIYGDFYSELMAIADKIGDVVIKDGEWVYLDGPIPVPAKLKELPSAGSEIDTDDDSVYDVDELLELTPSKVIDLDEIITKTSGGSITSTSYGVVKAYRYKSNPAVSDTDKDGYGDDEDLAPKVKFITPVVLLSGRGDNTAACFGAQTKLYYADKDKKLNSHYNSQRSLTYRNIFGDLIVPSYDYNDYSTHIINNIVRTEGGNRTPQNLAYELQAIGYNKNKNLFAFNYPNEDMTRANAQKFSNYLDSLAEYMSDSTSAYFFYPTEEDRLNKKIYVNLIGHSNGGLVSRYYIENMDGSSNVKSLITIDTPHWGSGLADISDNLANAYPMDIDLNPNNAIFGGTYKTYSSLNPFIQNKIAYINENQTDELNYDNHGSTNYYMLAGYDVASSVDVPISYLSKNMGFDLEIGNVDYFGEYEDAFKESFINNSDYPELASNFWFKDVFNLQYSDGDNVVNNQSQLGMKFSGDGYSNSLLKRIYAERMWMNIDTFFGHSMLNHFHGENQHRRETIQKVLEYLK